MLKMTIVMEYLYGGKNEQVGSPFDLGLITENDKGIPS